MVDLNRNEWSEWSGIRIDRKDIENAILKGKINKKLSEDIRGTRYRIEGPAKDGRMIQVICRSKEESNFIIITAYTL